MTPDHAPHPAPPSPLASAGSVVPPGHCHAAMRRPSDSRSGRVALFTATLPTLHCKQRSSAGDSWAGIYGPDVSNQTGAGLILLSNQWILQAAGPFMGC